MNIKQIMSAIVISVKKKNNVYACGLVGYGWLGYFFSFILSHFFFSFCNEMKIGMVNESSTLLRVRQNINFSFIVIKLLIFLLLNEMTFNTKKRMGFCFGSSA